MTQVSGRDALIVEPEDLLLPATEAITPPVLENCEGCGDCTGCLERRALSQSEVPVLLLMDTPEPTR